jgi:hypothetical protein
MEDKTKTKDDKTTIDDIAKGLVLLGVIVLVVYFLMLPLSLMISVTNEYMMYNMWNRTTFFITIGFSLALIFSGFILPILKLKIKDEEQI